MHCWEVAVGVTVPSTGWETWLEQERREVGMSSCCLESHQGEEASGFGDWCRRGHKSTAFFPACQWICQALSPAVGTTLWVILNSFCWDFCSTSKCCSWAFYSMVEHHWFVNWEDSNKKHLSFILCCFDLVIVLTDFSWEAMKQQFWLLPVSSCRTPPVFYVSFIQGTDSGLLSLRLFFLDPNEAVLLVCFLNRTPCNGSVQEDKFCLALVMLTCLSGRVRDSSRGQFSSGSQFQPPCVTPWTIFCLSTACVQNMADEEKRLTRCCKDFCIPLESLSPAVSQISVKFQHSRNFKIPTRYSF